MNKKEFNEAFNSARVEVLTKVNSTYKDELLKICDESGKVSTSELAVFVLSQSMNYTSDLIYSILSKVLVNEDNT